MGGYCLPCRIRSARSGWRSIPGIRRAGTGIPAGCACFAMRAAGWAEQQEHQVGQAMERRRLSGAKVLAAVVLASAAAAGVALAAAKPSCPECAAWNEPHKPFRIFADTYYVG